MKAQDCLKLFRGTQECTEWQHIINFQGIQTQSTCLCSKCQRFGASPRSLDMSRISWHCAFVQLVEDRCNHVQFWTIVMQGVAQDAAWVPSVTQTCPKCPELPRIASSRTRLNEVA